MHFPHDDEQSFTDWFNEYRVTGCAGTSRNRKTKKPQMPPTGCPPNYCRYDKDMKVRRPPNRQPPVTFGKRKKKFRGPDTAQKLPEVKPFERCRLQLLKYERLKDYLLLEKVYLKQHTRARPVNRRDKMLFRKVEELRGSPMGVGNLEEVIDHTHAIVSLNAGVELYVQILSFVDRDLLEPGCTVLLNQKFHCIVGVLADDADPIINLMKLEKAPQESYTDVGGLISQIQEIKEAVELPLTHPELYEDMGIKPPKGVILYGSPGTGKTLLAKAVANQTSATFLRVVGSELIQKYLGDGPKLVRELFRVAEEYAPSIVFIDEEASAKFNVPCLSCLISWTDRRPPNRQPPVTFGKRKKKFRGPDTAQKLPEVKPFERCRLQLLKYERLKDYLLLEKVYLKQHTRARPVNRRDKMLFRKVEELRGSPMGVGNLEEVIDHTHAIVSLNAGVELYVQILSFVDRDLLEPGCTVLLNQKFHCIVGVLADDADPIINLMKLEKAPQESYTDVGGLISQIQEIKEAVELPLTHPELYEDMGIKPPKGVILYGSPGTGKTLLAKAVANQTSATFLRVVGSELIQKYLGDGPKLVRELFRVAEEYAPSIVFIDEVDAIGTKRIESNSGGEREIQRTMLELLNQLDGFDCRSDIKVIMATNRIETLDPALIRPGRIDRKIEFPLPDEDTVRKILEIHTSRMTLADDVNLEEFVVLKDGLSGAELKAICTEAGLQALRDRRMKVAQEDFRKARESVLHRKKQGEPPELYL
ncbi:hypothetical protein M513_01119 [Trichuris suis]|uniref:26S proteasome regulatory subunit 4 homolog n=1 Tax=Trichuris suis TaxID=68888 RepID=A0A085MKZ0_9BILA|nr:hypothetical protein M513_01119 [Trichuris suis]